MRLSTVEGVRPHERVVPEFEAADIRAAPGG
jgi:hypothetical protein